jgi:hypothetical protein
LPGNNFFARLATQKTVFVPLLPMVLAGGTKIAKVLEIQDSNLPSA